VFTGIIEETGIIRTFREGNASARLVIETREIAHSLKIGDSVAVNGVCLTAVEIRDRSFAADLSMETLKRSSLGRAKEGLTVNLERPVAVGDRLGGHIVQGHVDGVGSLVSAIASGGGMQMEFRIPPEFERYLVSKGSVAIDGISLTVAALKKQSFSVAVIPHTYRATNLGSLKAGDAVNLEADIFAKYIDRFFQLGLMGDSKRALTVEKLREQGY
jgi:riboflavin synthase